MAAEARLAEAQARAAELAVDREAFDFAVDVFGVREAQVLARERLLRLEAVIDHHPISATTPVVKGETVPAGLRRIRAASLTDAHAAANAGVAVLDTGLDLANGDLNAASGANCIRPGTAAQDDHGHGTHVGGTLAGRNTGAGVVGVAPSTRLHAVKVMGAKGTGTLSQTICGIDWVTVNAASLNIRAVNMSITSAGTSDGNCGQTNVDPQHKAICASVRAGLTYVVSAGNSSTNFATSVPAAYPEVLTVTAATDTDGQPGGKGPAPCAKGEADDTYATYSTTLPPPPKPPTPSPRPGPACSRRSAVGEHDVERHQHGRPHVAGAVALCFGNGGGVGPCAGMTPPAGHATDARRRGRCRVGRPGLLGRRPTRFAPPDGTASSEPVDMDRFLPPGDWRLYFRHWLFPPARPGGAKWIGRLGTPLRPVAGRHFGYLASIAGY